MPRLHGRLLNSTVPPSKKLSILSAILAYPNIPPLTLVPAGGSEIFLLPIKRLIRPAIMEFRR